MAGKDVVIQMFRRVDSPIIQEKEESTILRTITSVAPC